MNSQTHSLHFLAQKKLIILIGKGGVGKTILTCSLGLALRQLGKQVLLAEVRTQRRIPPLFGHVAGQDGPLRLAPAIRWINLTPQAALETYAMRLLKLRTVYKAVFEQKAVSRFLRAVPSLAEILMLGHLKDMTESSSQVVVLDAPSTGPGALMLEAPRAIIETAPAGPLREGAEWIRQLLSDEKQTTANLVVIPEELPVNEAIDLHHRLRDSVAVPQGAVFVNRTLPQLFRDGPQVAELHKQIGQRPLGVPVWATAETYRKRLGLQSGYLDKLAAGIDLPCILLPEVFHIPELDSPGAPAVDGIVKELGGHFQSHLGAQ